jgi:hypothetical protein
MGGVSPIILALVGGEMCGQNEIKKSRLFYYEEACDGWIPAPDKISELIDLDQFIYNSEVIEILFKRIDMTDTEFENLPET